MHGPPQPRAGVDGIRVIQALELTAFSNGCQRLHVSKRARAPHTLAHTLAHTATVLP